MSKKFTPFVLWGLILLILITISMLVYGIIFPDKTQDWIGTNAYVDGNGEIVSPPKTLWDLLDLLVIPVVLTIVAFLFNNAQRRIEFERAGRNAKLERELTDDRNQEAALGRYIDEISKLILEKQLIDSEEGSPIQIVARTQTRTILRGLNSTRKSTVLRFLLEAGLIDVKNAVVLLTGADFREVDLSNANLSHSNLVRVNLSYGNLERVNLTETNLAKANLTKTILCSSNLKNAKLSRANLCGADLSEANLIGAELIRADLTNSILVKTVLNKVKLNGADLRGANLCGAKLGQTDLSGVKLKGALCNSDTVWPTEFDLHSSSVKFVNKNNFL